MLEMVVARVDDRGKNCQMKVARAGRASRHFIPGSSALRKLAARLNLGHRPILEAMTRSLTKSLEFQRRAERFLPGGVNSPVRAFRAVGGAPPFVGRAEGAYLSTPTATATSTTSAPGAP